MKSGIFKTRSLFVAMFIIIGLALGSCSKGYGCYYGSADIMEKYEYTSSHHHDLCAP